MATVRWHTRPLVEEVQVPNEVLDVRTEPLLSKAEPLYAQIKDDTSYAPWMLPRFQTLAIKIAKIHYTAHGYKDDDLLREADYRALYTDRCEPYTQLVRLFYLVDIEDALRAVNWAQDDFFQHVASYKTVRRTKTQLLYRGDYGIYQESDPIRRGNPKHLDPIVGTGLDPTKMWGIVAKRYGPDQMACCGEPYGLTAGCWISLVPGQPEGEILPYKLWFDDFNFFQDWAQGNYISIGIIQVGTAFRDEAYYRKIHTDIASLITTHKQHILDMYEQVSLQYNGNPKLDPYKALDSSSKSILKQLVTLQQLFNRPQFNKCVEFSRDESQWHQWINVNLFKLPAAVKSMVVVVEKPKDVPVVLPQVKPNRPSVMVKPMRKVPRAKAAPVFPPQIEPQEPVVVVNPLRVVPAIEPTPIVVTPQVIPVMLTDDQVESQLFNLKSSQLQIQDVDWVEIVQVEIPSLISQATPPETKELRNNLKIAKDKFLDNVRGQLRRHTSIMVKTEWEEVIRVRNALLQALKKQKERAKRLQFDVPAVVMPLIANPDWPIPKILSKSKSTEKMDVFLKDALLRLKSPDRSFKYSMENVGFNKRGLSIIDIVGTAFQHYNLKTLTKNIESPSFPQYVPFGYDVVIISSNQSVGAVNVPMIMEPAFYRLSAFISGNASYFLRLPEDKKEFAWFKYENGQQNVIFDVRKRKEEASVWFYYPIEHYKLEFAQKYTKASEIFFDILQIDANATAARRKIVVDTANANMFSEKKKVRFQAALSALGKYEQNDWQSDRFHAIRIGILSSQH